MSFTKTKEREIHGAAVATKVKNSCLIAGR